jgi:beta-glucosidase
MRYIGIALFIAVACSLTAVRGQAAENPDARAAAVEAQMSYAERIQLLHGIMALPTPTVPAIPAGIKITAGYFQRVPRLVIPDLLETDARLGVVNPLQLRPSDDATALPSSLSLGATFNPDAAFKAGAMIGAEVHAKALAAIQTFCVGSSIWASHAS